MITNICEVFEEQNTVNVNSTRSSGKLDGHSIPNINKYLSRNQRRQEKNSPLDDDIFFLNNSKCCKNAKRGD